MATRKKQESALPVEESDEFVSPMVAAAEAGEKVVFPMPQEDQGAVTVLEASEAVEKELE